MARHAALSGFDVLQELSPESGDVTLLARSKGGSLTTIKILIEKAVPDDVQSALTREASLGARLAHEAVVKARALLLEPDVVIARAGASFAMSAVTLSGPR